MYSELSRFRMTPLHFRTSSIGQSATVVLLAVLAVTALYPAARVSAQDQGPIGLYGLSELGETNPLALLRQRYSSSVLSGLITPMEGAVDPAEYHVGPGDLFTVSVSGQDITPAPIRVGADGRLALPGAGTVLIGGLSLLDARERILDALRRSYSNTDVDVSLSQPRQFYVHVSGAVPSPSRYLALPVSRVSNVLELAFADTSRSPVANIDFRPSLRNVRVIHNDGTEQTVDLLRYYSGGETGANPLLRDGDVVFVPAFNPDFSSVYVGGAVPFPGAYDHRPGDTIADLLAVAGGVPDGDTVVTIRHQRTTDTGRSEDFYTVSDFESGTLARIPVGRRDQISVQGPQELLGTVEAAGMLKFPGHYPITDGQTTLLDLIEAAGGIREDALLRGAYIQRRSLPEPDIDGRTGRFSVDLNSIQQGLKADTTEILQRMRLTDLDFLSRAYFVQEARLQNRVSVDVEAVVEGRAEPVVLRTGDRLVIPRDNESVYVIGQVRQPGFVQIVDGRDVDYYINAAGGKGDNGDEVHIMHPGSGAVSEPGERVLRSGDLIFVDRSEDVADSAELQRLVLEEARARQDARIRTTQTIAQAVSTIATVIALIVTLRNQ